MPERLANDFATALSAAVSSSATSLPVTTAAPSALQAGEFRVRVDDEIMLVTATGGSGASPWTVTRGVEGTTGAAHSSAAAVTHVLTAAALARAARYGPFYTPDAYGTFGTSATGTQNAAAIQAAIDAAAANGGGVVFVPEGTFTVRQIVMKSHVTLKGAGHLATRLVLEASQNKPGIINKVSSNGTSDPNALYFVIRDLCVDGNKANNTSGGGIFLSRNPQFAPATSDEAGDSDLAWENQATVENVMVLRSKGNGFASENIGTVRFANCFAEHCDGNGFYPGFDSQLIGCIASNSGLAGFHLDSPNIRVTACKSYYSGKSGTDSAGFRITANHQMLAGCESQDNTGPGYQIDSAHGSVIQACMADSNSTAGVGAYPGVDLWAANSNVIDVACSERKVGSSSWQQNAVQIRSTSANNQIQVTHWAEAGASIGAAVQAMVAGNTVIVNNQLGSQAVAYSSTVTPDPYKGGHVVIGTLTGNITVAAPSNAHQGCRLALQFTEDGTGGRTITLNAIFKKNWTPTTTANKVNTIEFVYDGTNWVQVAGTVGI